MSGSTAELQPQRYQNLVDLTEQGVFDNCDYGKLLKATTRAAKHVVSPFASGEMKPMYEDPSRFDYLKDFLERGKNSNRLIPYDDIFCVEDNLSAILMHNTGNSGETSVFLFESKPGVDIVASATVQFHRFYGRDPFYTSDPGFCDVVQEKEVGHLGERLLATALVTNQAVRTAVEQLAFMEQVGMLR